MKYPDPSDYFKAVQMTSSFKIDKLKRAEFVKNPPLYLPMPFSGSYAVVFKAIVGGEEQALRFFTREHAPSRERYQALGDYFTSKGISDCMAMSQWVDNAIVIDGQSWPMVQMQWVNGRTLNLHVDSLVEQRDVVAIADLAAEWRNLIGRMQTARFAHGDLQHGNVLVDEKGALRLVDFDCVWIEPFSGKSPPGESGHRNYQRTGRPWGQWMDTFPGLVVYVSLLALSKNPDLWNEFHDGENLLFRQEDFDSPHQTDIWRHLADIKDGQLNRLCEKLTSCCVSGWVAGRTLEGLLLPWRESGEYLEPGSLKQRLDCEGPLPLNEVLQFGIKVAAALAAAHCAGILYRDIKPDNILVSGYGEPALSAWTLRHTAPELLEGAPPNQASDVYALGSTLYQLLSGYPAHRRDTDESIAPVLPRILSENPPDISQSEIPNQVMGVVRKAMAKQPQDRFADPLTFATALQELQTELGFTATELLTSGVEISQPTRIKSVASHPSLSRSSNSENTERPASRLGISSPTTLPELGISAKILSAGGTRHEKVPSKYRLWHLVLISLIAVIVVICGGVVAWGMFADFNPTMPARASAPSTVYSFPSSVSVPTILPSTSAIPVPTLPPAEVALIPQWSTTSIISPPQTVPDPEPAYIPRSTPQDEPLIPEESESPPLTTYEPTPTEDPSAAPYNAQQLSIYDVQGSIYSVYVIGHSQYDFSQIESCFETSYYAETEINIYDIYDWWWAGEVQVYTYSDSNCNNQIEGGYVSIYVPSVFDGYYWVCLTADYFSSSPYYHESC